MNKNLYCSLLFILFPLFTFAQASLTINIEGLKEVKGDIYIGLYNSESTFRNTDSVYMKMIIPVDSLSMTTVMENLDVGTYALTLFHDKNSNGKLDTGLFGKPKEKYGFSNNPRVLFKAPDFKKCHFMVEDNSEIHIMMH